MTSIRDIKRTARKALHGKLAVRAYYLVPVAGPTGSSPAYQDPLAVSVRIHTKFDTLGDMKGTSFSYAERQEAVPKIVFMRNEVNKPVRGAVVSVEEGEAYLIDNIQQPDDITVIAEVTRLPVARTTGLPVPPADPSNDSIVNAGSTLGTDAGKVTEDEAIGISLVLG